MTGSATHRPRSLTASAVMTYGTNVAVAAISFVNVLVVARVLGPAGRGDFTLFATIAALTATLAYLGVQDANANIAGSKPHLRRSLATNSAILAAILGCAFAGGLAVLLELYPPIAGDLDPTLRWLAVAMVPILVARPYFELLLQADYRFGFTNAVWLVVPLANLAANGVLAAVGVLTATTAAAAWSAGQLVTLLALVWYWARRWVGFGRPDVPLARGMLRFGITCQPSRILSLANYRLDQWILGGVAGSRELGLYSVAVAWAEGLLFVPTTVASVQRPDLVRASPEDAGRHAATALRIGLIITIPAAAIMIVAAPFLCVSIFGSEFRGSIGDLRVLAAATFGLVVLKLLGNALVSQGKPLRSQAAIALAFIATIVFDILLIPRLGGLGAAIASLIAYSIAGVAVATIFVRTFGMSARELVPRASDVSFLWSRLRSAAHALSGSGRRLLRREG